MTKKKKKDTTLKIDASFHEVMKRAVNTSKKNKKPEKKRKRDGSKGGSKDSE